MSEPRFQERTGNTPHGGKRNWADLSWNEMSQIAEFYNTKNADKFLEAVEQLGTSVPTLTRRCREFNIMARKATAEFAARSIYSVSRPIYDGYTVIDTDNAIVISDIEIPDHDPRMLRLALLAGMRHNIRTLILAGDVVASDQGALNSWVNTWAEENELTYRQRMKILKDLIRSLAEWFTDGIVAITGNHDQRLAKTTEGQVTLEMLLEGEPIDYSMYSYLYLHHSDDTYTYVCHQYNYSKTPVKLAQDIWAVESTPDGSRSKMNVIVTHTHIAQDGWSPDGNWRCISMGCMRDPKKTKYMRMKATGFNQRSPALVGSCVSASAVGVFAPLTRRAARRSASKRLLNRGVFAAGWFFTTRRADNALRGLWRVSAALARTRRTPAASLSALGPRRQIPMEGA